MAAQKLRDKRHVEIASGTYQDSPRKTWEQFRKDYETKVLAGKAIRTRDTAKTSFAHFERILKPARMASIKTQSIDNFIAARRKEPGDKKGSLLSPASVNRDLRHIKAALRVALEWGYLPILPKFRMEKEPKKLPTYVIGDDFAAIYKGCAAATLPEGMPYETADWWRGLMVMGSMTGWRIGDMLALRRDDLDLEDGTAITRAADNKGKRDEKVKLHPVVLAHLKKLAGFGPLVFPWNHNPRTLYDQVARIQEKAGIRLPCPERHEHTPSCHVYGFHDLRRAFATMNADKLTADALQVLMRHKSYQTTQVYINLSRQMDAAVASLHVPAVLQGKGG